MLNPGPASVPAHAYVVGSGEDAAVAWTATRKAADDGPVLTHFANLALRSDPAAAVVDFVQRFGPLLICEEHGVSTRHPGGDRCSLLKPEPVSVWLEHARSVARILHVREALDKGTAPDPLETSTNDSWRSPYPAMRKQVERWLRERRASGPWPTDLQEEIDSWAMDMQEEINSWAADIEERRSRVAQLRAVINELQPATTDEWEEWIALELSLPFYWHRPLLVIGFDPKRRALRIAMSDGMDLLTRVYIELAAHACGGRTIALCTSCARAYSPSRLPKRGQANYCPSCRSQRVPARDHARRKRVAARGPDEPRLRDYPSERHS